MLSEVPLIFNGTPANGTIRGEIGSIGNPNLTPPTVVLNQSMVMTRFQYNQTLDWGYAFVSLHETIHLAGHGTYSDRELAQAAYDLGGLSEKEKKRFDELKKDDIDGNSAFLSNILKKHCP